MNIDIIAKSAMTGLMAAIGSVAAFIDPTLIKEMVFFFGLVAGYISAGFWFN
jgi:hypothetical protein